MVASMESSTEHIKNAIDKSSVQNSWRKAGANSDDAGGPTRKIYTSGRHARHIYTVNSRNDGNDPWLIHVSLGMTQGREWHSK